MGRRTDARAGRVGGKRSRAAYLRVRADEPTKRGWTFGGSSGRGDGAARAGRALDLTVVPARYGSIEDERGVRLWGALRLSTDGLASIAWAVRPDARRLVLGPRDAAGGLATVGRLPRLAAGTAANGGARAPTVGGLPPSFTHHYRVRDAINVFAQMTLNIPGVPGGACAQSRQDQRVRHLPRRQRAPAQVRGSTKSFPDRGPAGWR